MSVRFFFNDTATTEIYTLSLHDALPIYFDLRTHCRVVRVLTDGEGHASAVEYVDANGRGHVQEARAVILCGYTLDRKSTRLNSSHANISYAVFCLKKKKNKSALH